MDRSLFSADQKLTVTGFWAEVEAGSSCVPGNGGFLVLGRGNVSILVLQVNHVDSNLLFIGVVVFKFEAHD